MAAILSGALANVGSYGLLRFGDGLLPRELGPPAVLVLGTASIAYSAIGQAGHVLVALGIGGPVGYAAAVLYAVVNPLNKALLFLAAGLRGPLIGAAFAVGAFSVAGVPPTVGLLGKMALFESDLAAETVPTSVVLILLGGALSFVYSFQIYQRRFWAPGGRGPESSEDPSKPSAVAPRVLVLLLAFVATLALARYHGESRFF